MIPAMCRVKHDPENGTYGDCVRAVVASLMDMDTEDVPHFYGNGEDGTAGMKALADWLRPQGFVPFWSAFDGSIPLEQILASMQIQNPDVYYMLNGAQACGGSHVVVCRGDRIVHDPAWIKSPIIGPVDGWYVVMVIARA
jgi:hypothetical protein